MFSNLIIFASKQPWYDSSFKNMKSLEENARRHLEKEEKKATRQVESIVLTTDKSAPPSEPSTTSSSSSAATSFASSLPTVLIPAAFFTLPGAAGSSSSASPKPTTAGEEIKPSGIPLPGPSTIQAGSTTTPLAPEPSSDTSSNIASMRQM